LGILQILLRGMAWLQCMDRLWSSEHTGVECGPCMYLPRVGCFLSCTYIVSAWTLFIQTWNYSLLPPLAFRQQQACSPSLATMSPTCLLPCNKKKFKLSDQHLFHSHDPVKPEMILGVVAMKPTDTRFGRDDRRGYQLVVST
jgi:hypothetical protein